MIPITDINSNLLRVIFDKIADIIGCNILFAEWQIFIPYSFQSNFAMSTPTITSYNFAWGYNSNDFLIYDNFFYPVKGHFLLAKTLIGIVCYSATITFCASSDYKISVCFNSNKYYIYVEHMINIFTIKKSKYVYEWCAIVDDCVLHLQNHEFTYDHIIPNRLIYLSVSPAIIQLKYNGADDKTFSISNRILKRGSKTVAINSTTFNLLFDILIKKEYMILDDLINILP